jgi:nucleoid-associated protein YgaU
VLRLVQLAVLGVVVLGATVLMALPRRASDAQANPGTEVADRARSGETPAPGSDVSVAPPAPGGIVPDTGPLVPPAPPSAPAAPAAAPRTHQVASGETLQKIAKRYYGTVNRWRRIADANPGVDPSRLRPGTSLVIPP